MTSVQAGGRAEEVEEFEQEIARLKRELQQAREALRPFVELADELEENGQDWDSLQAWIQREDWEAARDALTGHTPRMPL